MLICVSPADKQLVSLEQAKTHCRVDHSDDDALLADLISAACAMVQHDIGRVLQPSSWEARLSTWRKADIDLGPVRDIEGIAYYDASGTLQALPSASWRWEQTRKGARVWLTTDVLPALDVNRDLPVAIRFEAGFNDPAATDGEGHLVAPPEARQAALLLIGHWYHNREAYFTGTIGTTFALAYERLTDTARTYR